MSINSPANSLNIIHDLQNAYQNLFNNIMLSNDMFNQEDNEIDILNMLLGFAQLIVYYNSAIIATYDNGKYNILTTMNMDETNLDLFNKEDSSDFYEWAKDQVRPLVVPEDDINCHIIVPIMTKDSYIGILHVLADVEADNIPKQDLDMLWLICSSVSGRIERLRYSKRSELIETLLILLEKIKASENLDNLLYSIINGINKLMDVESSIMIKLNNRNIVKTNTEMITNLPFIINCKDNENCNCNLVKLAINKNSIVYTSEENCKKLCSLCSNGLCDFLETHNLMIVPLESYEKIYGVLAILESKYNNQLHHSEARHIIELFAKQVSIAINQFQLFEELQFQKEQAQTFNKAKSDFLANMSHEIRTPLTSVIGYADVLQMGIFGKLNDKQIEAIMDIKNSGNHLLNLINDILDISKIEVGKMDLNLEKIDHKKIINEVNILIKPLSDNKKINITVNLTDNLEYIVADSVRFKQILFNLLSNAIKFTDISGNVAVRSRYSKNEQLIYFSVIDDGIGIAEQNFDQVFEKFRQIQSDKMKKVTGTGLGLSLTKQLVELHNGKIWFTSEIGEGTIFTFTLPVRD
ncbi:MAG: HAMP domain-containing sensor histidine kinase [Cyanobacteriota bacterium]